MTYPNLTTIGGKKKKNFIVFNRELKRSLKNDSVYSTNTF